MAAESQAIARRPRKRKAVTEAPQTIESLPTAVKEMLPQATPPAFMPSGESVAHLVARIAALPAHLAMIERSAKR